MNIIKYNDSAYSQEIDALVQRCDVDFQSQDETVRTILQAVKKDRDEALLKFTNQFDQTDFQLTDLEVQPEEIQEAYNQVELAELDAMKLAAENIERFHARQVQESWEYKEGDVTLGQAVRPLSIVGIYVPGGKASYPSSVLMNAIPARVAGVEQVVMCSPTPKGEVSPHSLVAADIAGVDRVFKVGGAQAVAAMALGNGHHPARRQNCRSREYLCGAGETYGIWSGGY